MIKKPVFITLAFIIFLTSFITPDAYAADDRGDDMASATSINLNENVTGVMNSSTDKDFFKFTAVNSGIHI
ncbi:MAG: hypothetical protein PHV32_05350, partial [Eubacteriales bacterium]|nr:hypothetical protein [Eubacteriales bacterium]